MAGSAVSRRGGPARCLISKLADPELILREFQRDIHCKKVQWSNEIWAQRSSADVGEDESSFPQFGIRRSG